ncbi:CotH kinase family protein [Streptomyces sp. NPDC060198]|uniref:CotH kinase family protein n=1 Tax=Streptomyces sp. NPDC060198 TaxID=3347070 RepID=UPI0036592842
MEEVEGGAREERRTPPRKRLAHRVPLPVRHHWKPVGLLCAGLAVLLVFFSDARVTPFVTSASVEDADVITENLPGTVGLYDTTAAHTFRIEYDQSDFDKMMKAYEKDGTKDTIEADLTIDGTYLDDVGIRLKGNSTLQSLRGSGGGPGGPGGAGGFGGQGGPQGQDQGQGQGQDQQEQGQGRQGQDQGGQAAGGMRAGGGGMTQYDLSADKPEELPWLVKIDEYVEGRAYQGNREISLRPGVDDQLPLNEALSLSLMEKSGQPAEKFGFVNLTVNNRPAATRLMVENPSKDYVEQQVAGDGVAYKARAGGSFDYVGDDPTEYETSFKQLNKKGSQDLAPVMRLLKWVDQASDEEFAADLDRYVDVDSFAAYVATQNLILNFDDMAGPGNNYVLWYDLDTKKFSVLGWDFNLTFSGDATSGPDDSTSMGGFGGGGGGAMPGAAAGGQDATGAPGTTGAAGGQDATGDQSAPAEGRFPGGGEPPAGGFPTDGELPADGGFPAGGQGGPPGAQDTGGQDTGAQDTGGQAAGGQAAGGRMGGGGGMGGNALKEKFLAADAFDTVYHAAYKKLYEQYYGSGYGTSTLDTLVTAAKKSGADASGVESTAKSLRTTLTSRTESLAKDKVITGG